MHLGDSGGRVLHTSSARSEGAWGDPDPTRSPRSSFLRVLTVALLAHLPQEQMAVGTGFGQVFRGLGQVGGVAISSAIFQYKLDTELNRRIVGPDAEEASQRPSTAH
ncbi:hypothetical protein PAXINDRAFT_96734 [Paxillus involutus ATCC 200175]|nr:hypothetical protein PAXINDRAFT_96734 [Paxillus involutus ATCC 200175]